MQLSNFGKHTDYDSMHWEGSQMSHTTTNVDQSVTGFGKNLSIPNLLLSDLLADLLYDLL